MSQSGVVTLHPLLTGGVRELLRDVRLFGTGVLAPGRRRLPDWLIIGAPRSGTYAMLDYLVRHPDVGPPQRKEIRFFDLRWHRGLEWYRLNFPPAGACRSTGEASPQYLCDSRVPGRILRSLGRIPLICLLRDPVERTYSSWAKNRKVGFETATFEDALARERDADQRGLTLFHPALHYVRRSRFADQLPAWLDTFGSVEEGGRLLILSAAEFWENPAGVYARTLAHIGLPDWQPGSFEQVNAAGRAPMAGETRQMLTQTFEEHNRALGALLDRHQVQIAL